MDTLWLASNYVYMCVLLESLTGLHRLIKSRLTCDNSHQTFTPPTVPRSTTTKYSLSGVSLNTQTFTDFVNVATTSVNKISAR